MYAIQAKYIQTATATHLGEVGVFVHAPQVAPEALQRHLVLDLAPDQIT